MAKGFGEMKTNFKINVQTKHERFELKFTSFFSFSSLSLSVSRLSGGQNNETIQLINLNWLIHLSYARGEFKYCKEVIEHQLQSTYDHEFLYLMKVYACAFRLI